MVIVVVADGPMPVRAYWLSWLAVATAGQAALVRRLSLTEVRPSTWPEAVTWSTR
ncbi:hypothetical protein SAMN05421812_10699 [Asanoa hainanensis]|uniref:Uncharacterized protein n=1 Tax=Asanoa hainanensis TaxID=560556 RepID=A0A239MQC9_9ACTN|nr:hypothetical protein SAMN05421812_10699 [Asanoa hainanensis]